MTGANDVLAVPETALRSALEFAVGIAAAGQKRRPPLQYPAGLKPLLKLNRLDRASLRIARRAVAADPAFRERIATVATPDLVDALGIVWLQRPPNWQARLAELLVEAKDSIDNAAAEAQARKADKRREAAEHAALRAQAELAAHHELVQRERVLRLRSDEQLAAATERAVRAERELDSVRHEIARLEDEIAASRERTESELTQRRQVEAINAQLAQRLRDAEQMRDHVLAQRANESTDGSHREPAGNAHAAAALRRASEATSDLAAALAAAGEALNAARSEPAQPRSIRQRNAKRTPIAIPGGLYGDSLAATMHLLRTANVVVVVDGYNVAKLAWPHLELGEQRNCCIDMCEDLVRRTGANISIVFDGADVVGASAARRRLVRVHYSPSGVIADDVIRGEIGALSVATPVLVVTNDQAVAADVRALGANVVSSDAFISAAGRAAPSASGSA